MANQFQMQAIIKAVDKVSAPMRKIMNNLAPVGRQFKSIGQAASKFGGHLKSILSPLAILGSAVSVAGIVKMTKSVATYGDTVKNTAERVGWSAKALQEFSYAAKFSNMTSEEFTGSLEFMNKRMGQLRAGTGPLVSGLQKVSPVLLKQIKAAKSNEEAFDLMVSAIQKVDDADKKDYLSNLFFGTNNMTHLANQGADGLKRLRKEANETGNVLGDDALKASSAFNDSMSRLTEVISGFSKTIGAKLLPIITPIIERITKWVMANRELIATKIEKFIEKLANWLQRIDFEKIFKGVQKAANVIGKFIDMIGGMENAFIALLVIMNGGLISSFIGLGLSITKLIGMIVPFKAILSVLGSVIIKIASVAIPLMIKGFIALGTAIMTTPVGWIMAAIAAIAGAAYLIYKNWEPIKEFFTGLWDGIVEAFSGAWDFIKDSVSKMGQWVLEKSGISTVLKVIDKVKGWFSSGDSKKAEEAGVSSESQPNLSASMAGVNAARDAKAEVVVKFDNMPRGASVNSDTSGQGMDLGVETGYAMPAAVR